MGTQAALPDLLRMVGTDPDFAVREAAAYALGQLPNQAAARALLAVLRDPDEDADVRSRAAESLGDLALAGVEAAPETVSELLRVLTNADRWVRHDSAIALGYLRDPRALPALSGKLEHDPNPTVREAAASTLCWLQDKRGVVILTRALEDLREDPLFEGPPWKRSGTSKAGTTGTAKLSGWPLTERETRRRIRTVGEGFDG